MAEHLEFRSHARVVAQKISPVDSRVQLTLPQVVYNDVYGIYTERQGDMSQSNRLPRLMCWLHKPTAKPSRNKTPGSNASPATKERRSHAIVHGEVSQGSTATFPQLAATEQAAGSFSCLRTNLNELRVLCCACSKRTDRTLQRTALVFHLKGQLVAINFLKECGHCNQVAAFSFLGLLGVFVSCCVAFNRPLWRQERLL